MMAVILHEKKILSGKEITIKTYYPSGILSKEDRLRAEALDKFLEKEMPKVSEKTLKQAKGKGSLFKWYLLGKELQKIVNNKKLVLYVDMGEEEFWQAFRQHFPDSFGLKGTGEERESYSKRHGSRDQLAVCYEFGRYNWDSVKWLQRWDDWCQIYYRKRIILDDERVFNSLSQEIGQLEKYPNRQEFRQIISNIVEKFSKKVNLDDGAVKKYIRDAIEKAYVS